MNKRRTAKDKKNNSSEKSADEIRLRESEENLRLLIESATDYAIFTLTSDNSIKTWNAGAERIFGFSEKEILGENAEILFTPEDRAKGVPEQEMQTALEKGRAEDERWHLRKDGSRFFASGIMQPLSDRSAGFVKIARDMTEKIQADQTKRDKELLQKLVGAQEDERRRIARDLHDELGQELTVLRLKLDSVKNMCEDDALCAQIVEAQEIAQKIDLGVDFLAWELRPAALDDLGLVPAIEKFVGEWSRYTGIEAELLATKLKKSRFFAEVETNLYRIVQEALNNVHKHAQATRIEIQLERRDDLVVLVIEDNGRGFEPKEGVQDSVGMGLIGMKERAELIGGSFEIESAPRKGTTLYIRVPVSSNKKGIKNN